MTCTVYSSSLCPSSAGLRVLLILLLLFWETSNNFYGPGISLLYNFQIYPLSSLFLVLLALHCTACLAAMTSQIPDHSLTHMVHGKCPKGNGGTGVLPGSPEFGPMLDLYFSKHRRPLVSVACPVCVWLPLYFRQGSWYFPHLQSH